MSDFDKARARFTEAAAKALKVSADTLTVSPASATTGGEDYDTRKTGAMLPFEAKAGSSMIRGYASAEAVATASDLAPFMAAAKVPEAPTLDGKALAHRLRWITHPGATDLTSAGSWMVPPDEDADPRVTPSADGGAQVIYFAQKGGATGTVAVFKVEIAVAKDHGAKVKSTYMVPE